MINRRIMSLWFPRLPVERVLRLRKDTLPFPVAIVGDRNGAQALVSLNEEAEAAGLCVGQPLRDASAMCGNLVTHSADPLAEAAFLGVLRRWAGKFSPWVAEEAPASLMIDLTGCAHLFGGEPSLLAQAESDCADLGLTVQAGIADTAGAAWALARFAGQVAGTDRNGDAIDQEARATRSRAVKRRGWERGGAAPALGAAVKRGAQGCIAAAGNIREALAPLPLAALRLAPEVTEGLARLGLRRVDDLLILPRAPFARRFGAAALRRLDQALGAEPEPITPARAPLYFATRITFPDPIGLRTDLEAAIDRLLPALCARLVEKGRGARQLRLQSFRSDGKVEGFDVGLARPADQAARIRPLLLLKLDSLDPGLGIDRLRLEVTDSEPLHVKQHRGHFDTNNTNSQRNETDGALDDLISILGAKLGCEAVIWMHPAQSRLPDQATLSLAAAWADPASAPWPKPPNHRPLLLFPPESTIAPAEDEMPPARFRWRGRELVTRMAIGPERILPEWWLAPAPWRSGARNYWRIEAGGGERLWVFHAKGLEVSGGWYCEGTFC